MANKIFITIGLFVFVLTLCISCDMNIQEKSNNDKQEKKEKGIVLLEKKKFSKAEKYYREMLETIVVKKDPLKYDYMAGVIISLYYKNNSEKALEELESILAEYENDLYLNLLKGYILFKKIDQEQGFVLLKQADKLEGIKISEKTLLMTQEDVLSEHDRKMLRYGLSLKLKEYIEKYESYDPLGTFTFDNFHSTLSDIYFELGEINNGIKQLKKILMYDPDNIETVLNLSRTYQKVGDLENAIKLATYIWEIDTENKENLLYLCDLYYQANNLTKAVKHYITFKKKFPDHKDMMEVDKKLALIYKDLSLYDKSLKIFDELLKKHKNDYQINLGYAEVLFKIGDMDNANDLVTKLIDKHPRKHQAYLLLANVLLDNRSYFECWEILKNLYKTQKKNPQAHHHLSRFFYEVHKKRLGNYFADIIKLEDLKVDIETYSPANTAVEILGLNQSKRTGKLNFLQLAAEQESIAIAYDKENPDYHYFLGQYYYENGMTILEEYDMLMNDRNYRIEHSTDLTRLRQKYFSYFDIAITEYHIAHNKRPLDKQIVLSMAWAYLKRNDYQMAYRYFTKALKLDPYDMQIMLMIRKVSSFN